MRFFERKSKDSFKVCFENVNIKHYVGTVQFLYNTPHYKKLDITPIYQFTNESFTIESL